MSSQMYQLYLYSIPIKRLPLLYIFMLSLFGHLTTCLKNGVALTPPMGWMSWERFRCNIDCRKDPRNCINEQLFMTMADHLVKDGYRDVGYRYVNIDDCWMDFKRSSEGKLRADPSRFPHGIKFLADYMHERSLFLGIYTDFGEATCMGFPGTSFTYVERDIKTFIEWGIDMIKVDACHSTIHQLENGYQLIGQFLNKSEHPIVYSCSWPYYQFIRNIQPNWTKIAQTCNLWRNYDDIYNSWESICSIMNFYGDNQHILSKYNGPGHWNDPDMIIIGNSGLNYFQAKIQMAVWAILSAPLLMSNDLRNISRSFHDILTNKDIIAINQDPLGIQGKRIWKKDHVEIWVKQIHPIKNRATSFALLFINLNSADAELSILLHEIGLACGEFYMVKEVFTFVTHGVVNCKTKLNLTLHTFATILLKATLVSTPSSEFKKHINHAS